MSDNTPNYSPPVNSSVDNSNLSPQINSNMAGVTPINLHYDKSLSFRAKESMNTAQASITIIDSGASRSGTSDQSQLHSITAVSGVQISGAFGNTVQPTASGILIDLNLEALIVPGMSDQLVSVSQVCMAARDGIPKVGVFDDTGVTF